MSSGLKGSTPILLSLAGLFVLLFVWQRSRSEFLRVEGEAPALAAVAQRCGLDRASVLALRLELGPALPIGDFEARCAGFARWRGELGEPLAAVAAGGDAAAARAVLRRHGGDAAAAWAEFRADPAAAAGGRFLAMRARFAARAAARD